MRGIQRWTQADPPHPPSVDRADFLATSFADLKPGDWEVRNLGTCASPLPFRRHGHTGCPHSHRGIGDRPSGNSHFPGRHRLLVGVAENEPADVVSARAANSRRHAFQQLASSVRAASVPRPPRTILTGWTRHDRRMRQVLFGGKPQRCEIRSDDRRSGKTAAFRRLAIVRFCQRTARDFPGTLTFGAQWRN